MKPIYDNISESFILWYCVNHNLTYKKATFDQNYYKGIDCFIEGVPTDIKNTKGIFLGNLKKDKFLARHPFQKDTESKNYLFVECTKTKFELLYFGEIKEYLKDKYFNGDNYNTVVSIVSKYHLEFYYKFSKSKDQFFFNLKKELEPYMKPNIYIRYSDDAIVLYTFEDWDEIKEKKK